ncbi:carbohydrate ABC transporter permease [Haloferax marisrubri]|uniref:Sugar ABC transporter permease n=1 Tax=Haloferax marisrubri TaxID=1544719 RepID=A0A2P4NKS6_9EURY|nr:sugar ABC transporter permease [Haloferax marisrubri]
MATEHKQSSGFPRPDYIIANKLEGLPEELYAYLLLVPAFFMVGAVALWPLVDTFTMSLHADALTGVSVGDFIGIQNYVDVLTGQRNAVLPGSFWYAVGLTVVFTVGSVTLETVVGLAQALVLDQEFRGRAWVRMAIILPWAVPVVVQGMMFYLLFEPSIGFLVAPLQELGLFSSTPLSNTQDSLILITLTDAWKTSAFMALIILAGMQSIDRSLYDVSKVAGATAWQRFKLITFPLVLPAVLVGMLFRTLGALKVYGVIEVLSGCRTVPSMTCLVISAFRSNRYGTSATLAFLTALIISAFILVYLVKFVDSLRGIGGSA